MQVRVVNCGSNYEVSIGEYRSEMIAEAMNATVKIVTDEAQITPGEIGGRPAPGPTTRKRSGFCLIGSLAFAGRDGLEAWKLLEMARWFQAPANHRRL